MQRLTIRTRTRAAWCSVASSPLFGARPRSPKVSVSQRRRSSSIGSTTPAPTSSTNLLKTCAVSLVSTQRKVRRIFAPVARLTSFLCLASLKKASWIFQCSSDPLLRCSALCRVACSPRPISSREDRHPSRRSPPETGKLHASILKKLRQAVRVLSSSLQASLLVSILEVKSRLGQLSLPNSEKEMAQAFSYEGPFYLLPQGMLISDGKLKYSFHQAVLTKNFGSVEITTLIPNDSKSSKPTDPVIRVNKLYIWYQKNKDSTGIELHPSLRNNPWRPILGCNSTRTKPPSFSWT